MKFSIASILIISSVIIKSECSTFHSIGERIIGDDLLVNDKLKSSRSLRLKNHTIEFQYVIDKPVTNIQMFSDHNIKADFVLSFDKILYGNVTAINVHEFELSLSIFGFKDEGFRPRRFKSVLNPNIDIHGSLGEELDNETSNENDYVDEDIQYFDLADEIVLGSRQFGDKLVYEKFEMAGIDEPLTFYFVDNFYLTQAAFSIYESNNVSSEFFQFSQQSVKVILTESTGKNFQVNFKLFGFTPEEKPSNFTPMIVTVQDEELVTEIYGNEIEKTTENPVQESFNEALMFVEDEKDTKSNQIICKNLEELTENSGTSHLKSSLHLAAILIQIVFYALIF